MPGKFVFAIFVVAALMVCFSGGAAEGSRGDALQLLADGNYREAEAVFRRLALDPAAPAEEAAENVRSAAECLFRYLRLPEEAAALMEEAVAARPGEWRTAVVAAETLLRFGERYRGRAVSLLRGAAENPDGASADEKLELWKLLAQAVFVGREGDRGWRLTSLTDLSGGDGAEEAVPMWAFPARGAPADADGEPMYYRVPASWEAAANDGERWRWALSRMAETGRRGRAEAGLLFGEFLLSQFGVQTMLEWPGARDAGIAELAGEDGVYAVRTLRDDETIARLGGGLKRFGMPDEFNHIAVLRRVAESGVFAESWRARAILGSIFENRQQYPKAVAEWRRVPGTEGRLAVDRITAANGALEAGVSAPAGKRSVLSYLFRNGEAVDFTARRLDEGSLLADIRGALRSGGEEFFESYLHRRPEALGQFVFDAAGEKYVGGVAAEWSVTLDPLPDHFSRRVDVEVPVVDAGCYLIEAAMRDGNVSRIVLWIADTALVRKDANGEQLFFVADAATGEPAAGAEISFTGVRTSFDRAAGRQKYSVEEFAGRTDADGMLFVPAEKMNGAEWLIAAETGAPAGGLAYLGFDYLWSSAAPDEERTPASVFLLTDRPAYRPGQAVRYKAWLGRGSYAPAAGDSFAGRGVTVSIHSPRGEVVREDVLTADAYGGVDGEFVTGDGAPLGQYYISARAGDAGGGAGFRVEEYRKPEYEAVLDAPDGAIVLGDSVQLKVRAAYYYGAPVAGGSVTYRVLRTPHRRVVAPPWRWGWLYGDLPVAAAPDFMTPVRGMRMPFVSAQPEIVAEGEGNLDAEGVFRFLLDTAPAKEFFGDQDHEYRISFEVTDAGRRAIAGSGRVVAAREPFAVALWADKGYYRAGGEVRVDVRAELPLGGGAAAEGSATLHRVSFDGGGVRKETEAGRWDVATDGGGAGGVRFRAGEAGQYVLRVSLGGVEAETLITVRGEAGEGEFRFSPLELAADGREYAPGGKVRLAVNSANADGVVLLFPRAERAGKPAVLRLRNGAALYETDVGRADQPNFFFEALTVFGGETHSEVREIFVPPADRTLRAEVIADKDAYLPGEKAAFRILVTDADGEPVRGQCAVTLYDASVEYISGGSNTGDIRSAFWGRRRFHAANLMASLAKTPRPVSRENDAHWQPLGVFGGAEADWNGGAAYTNGLLRARPAVRMASMPDGMAMEAAAVTVDMAAPMAAAVAAPAPAPEMAMAKTETTAAYAGGDGGAGAMAEAAVRSEFADTAFWTAALETDADGRAEFVVDMPENLTAWKARVWVVGAESRAGAGGAEVVTRKNVLVRPQTPRFLTQKDRAVLSANVHNYLPRAKTARVELALEGGLLAAAEGDALSKEVLLSANGEARADWVVDALRPGTARVVMRVLTDEESDAAEISLPVLVRGARRVEGLSGVLRDGEAERAFRFAVPEARLAERSRAEFSFAPGILPALLPALPYLIDNPYGGTEQTLNRFLPALAVREYFGAAGVPPKKVTARDDAQSADWREHWGDDRARAAAEARTDLTEDTVNRLVAEGMERLAGMQNADGGWGWFSGAGESSWAHMTALVTDGLLTANALDNNGGAAAPGGMLSRGVEWLARHEAAQIALLMEKSKDMPQKARADSLDAFVHRVLSGAGRADARMREFLYRDRLELSLSGLAMLGSALAGEGRTEEAAMVARNLSQFVESNPDNGTAWLRVPERGWWLWQNDAVETQAWYLRFLTRTDPQGAAAAGVAKYLLENRRNGAYWRSTRDTAYAVRALAEYAAAVGEGAPDMTVRVFLDGARVMERRVTAESLLDDNRFVLDGIAVESGEHEIRIEREGAGTVYCTGNVSVFSLEEDIAAAGSDLTVSRKFYRLAPAADDMDLQTSSGAARRAETPKHVRTEIAEFAAGDLVEAELRIAATNDYEYLVFEDRKAAGLEAVSLTSGYDGNSLGAYVEYRDENVSLFVRRLPRGEHTVTYRFRAETPGSFTALPVFGGGMYAPELFCNSDAAKVRIAEEGVFE